MKRIFVRVARTMVELFNMILREYKCPYVWKKGILKLFLKSPVKYPNKVL